MPEKNLQNIFKLKKEWEKIIEKSETCLNYSITLNLWKNLEKSEIEKSLEKKNKNKKINLENAKIFENCESIETETEFSDFENFEIESEEFLSFSFIKKNDVYFEYEEIKNNILENFFKKKKNEKKTFFENEKNEFDFEIEKIEDFDNFEDFEISENEDFDNKKNILVISIKKKNKEKKLKKTKNFLDYDFIK